MIPIPPSRAIAIASRDSVTVSIAALTSGILIRILRETKVSVSTSLGTICDLAGTRTTSSYVSPNRGSLSSIAPSSNVLRSLRFLQLSQLLGLVLQPLTALFRRHESLHPRVAAVDDKDAPLRIDSDPIRKIELPVAVAKPTPLGDEIALTVELFDPMIPRIRHVDISGSVDGDTPRRAQLPGLLRQRTAGMPGDRTASPPRQQLREDVGAGVEFLDAVISHIDDIDRPVLLIDRHPAGEVELPVPVAEAAPGHDELAGPVEFLHTEIGAIDDIDIAAHTVDRNPPGGIELSFAVSTRTKLHEIAAELPIKLLNPVVVGIHHPNIALAVAGNTSGIVKIRIGRAETSPQNDEVPGIVELLHAIVAVVDDEHRSLLVDAQAVHRRHKLSAMQQGGASSWLPPFRDA